MARGLITRDASACPDCGQEPSAHLWVAMETWDYDSWRCRNGHVWATQYGVTKPAVRDHAAAPEIPGEPPQSTPSRQEEDR